MNEFERAIRATVGKTVQSVELFDSPDGYSAVRFVFTDDTRLSICANEECDLEVVTT